jgi:hypothetical protein
MATSHQFHSVAHRDRLNSVDPFAYLSATLSSIVNGHRQSRVDELPPWNWRYLPELIITRFDEFYSATHEALNSAIAGPATAPDMKTPVSA